MADNLYDKMSAILYIHNLGAGIDTGLCGRIDINACDYGGLS